MDNNIYLNYLQIGCALHSDIMIELQRKFIEKDCDKEYFILFAEQRFQLEAPIAVLIWQAFDAYEGFLLTSRNKDD